MDYPGHSQCVPRMSQNKPAQEKVKFAEKKNIRVYALTPYTTTIDTWNILCLPCLGGFLLAFGSALVVVGAILNIGDLIIIGCIFGIGSTIFFAMMYLTVCKPMCQRNIVQTTDMDQSSGDYGSTRPMSEIGRSSRLVDADFYNDAFDPNEDLITAKNRQQPSSNQLYGEQIRSFLATPATAADVTFYDDFTGTPPPPRLALPSEPGDSRNAVFTMDVEKEMTRKTKEMSHLELL